LICKPAPHLAHKASLILGIPKRTRSEFGGSHVRYVPAVRIFAATPFDTLAEGLLLFWDFLAARYEQPVFSRWPDTFGMSFSWLSISVPDAADTGSNTAAHVDQARAQAFGTKTRISRDKLLASYDARFDETLESHVLAALRA
jgi:hypothetical protein